MAKYGNVKLGMYDRLWSASDKKYLQRFIDESALLQVKYRFAYNHFKTAPLPCDTDAKGVATFRVMAATVSPDEMADFRAPLSDTTQMDRNGFADYMGTIPEIGKGFYEKAAERYQKEKIVAQFGNDTITNQLVANYINDLQRLKNTVDSRLSNMAAQLISTGSISGVNGEDNTVVWYKQDCPIPAANRVTAKTTAWTDANANLVEEMRQIEQDFRDRTGYTGAMKWNITLNMWRNVFLANAQLKSDIAAWRVANDKPGVTGGALSEGWVNEYLTALGLTSPIEIIEEKEVLAGTTIRSDVKGFADTIAVLRPVGYAGEFQWTGILDQVFAERFKSPTVVRTVANLNTFEVLINSTVDNAGYPEWHTDLFAAAVPTLTEFPYHVIVNTAATS